MIDKNSQVKEGRMEKFKGLMTSLSCEWATPQWLFDELNEEFCFTIDVCATIENAKCDKFYYRNSLEKKWNGRCWLNPPYGREIGLWIKKAYESKALVVALLPSRTDTKWWHDYVMKAKEIRFIKGRLKFGNSKNFAPFPSCIVIFNGGLN